MLGEIEWDKAVDGKDSNGKWQKINGEKFYMP